MAAKPRAVLVIGVIAVVIAAVASVLFYNYLKKQEEIVKEAVATQKVVVATRAIAVGSAIDSTQVSVVDWPPATLSPSPNLFQGAGCPGCLPIRFPRGTGQ